MIITVAHIFIANLTRKKNSLTKTLSITNYKELMSIAILKKLQSWMMSQNGINDFAGKVFEFPMPTPVILVVISVR